MNVAQVASVLDKIAPPQLAAQWDNVGLLLGDPKAAVRKVMLCIDLTGQVLAEAIAAKANLVMAYHPPIFKPLPRVTAMATPVVYQAIRKNIAVYSMHTALDVVAGGTNDVLADAMGLGERCPLEIAARTGQCKIVVFVPPDSQAAVAEAAFDAGAGHIGNYERCAFGAKGTGTFFGTGEAKPVVGRALCQETVEEIRLEMIAPRSGAAAIVAAVRKAHPYEEPAIDVVGLEDYPAGVGMGRIGTLGRPVAVDTLVGRIKKALGLDRVQIARPVGRRAAVTTAACGAGSCGPLFRAAVAQGAQFYLTGEMRHHDALAAAAGGMTVVCVGHSNSERVTVDRLRPMLGKLLAGVQVQCSRSDRDPFAII